MQLNKIQNTKMKISNTSLRTTHTHPFNGPLSGTTRVSRYQKGKNQSGFYWSKRQWVAVASARPYASLHLAPDRYHASTPPLIFYRPDALPATQPTVSKHWRHKCSWKYTCSIKQLLSSPLPLNLQTIWIAQKLSIGKKVKDESMLVSSSEIKHSDKLIVLSNY